MPRIALSVTGDLARDLAAVLARVAASALAGVSEAADKLRTRLSEQVVVAGLGQRLADSWECSTPSTARSLSTETTVSSRRAGSGTGSPASTIPSPTTWTAPASATPKSWSARPTARRRPAPTGSR
ncbi:hypothetical protein WCLP8_4780002 [uncultured Gammaproteobacteria bacterium]